MVIELTADGRFERSTTPSTSCPVHLVAVVYGSCTVYWCKEDFLRRTTAISATMNILQRHAAKKTLETLATGLSALRVARTALAPSAAKAPAWIFLGPPGVGKGTYSSRVASALGVPHIAAGDLVRQQIKDQTEFGCKVSSTPYSV